MSAEVGAYPASGGVVAVVVTYRPDLLVLNALLDTLVSQVAHVIVVDNGSEKTVASWTVAHTNVECLPQVENLGLARAQNLGIKRAKALGAAYVLLSDQDSLPAPDMVAQLMFAADFARASGAKLAAVGPRYLDPRQDNPPPFLRRHGWRIVRQPCRQGDEVVEVDYLIASGCLINIEVLDVLGGMAEDLFIDYVDIEWGLRARHAGYQLFGACGARMRHDLGEHPFRLFGKAIPVHSPLRHYYHFRNAIWLYRQPWLDPRWKFADGWRLFRKFLFYSLFTPPRLDHLRMMSRGVRHGLVGCMGRHDP